MRGGNVRNRLLGIGQFGERELDERGVNLSQSDRVDPNPVRRILNGKGLGERD